MQHLPNGAARRFRDNQYVRAFVLGLMMSFLVFLPFVIVDPVILSPIAFSTVNTKS